MFQVIVLLLISTTMTCLSMKTSSNWPQSIGNILKGRPVAALEPQRLTIQTLPLENDGVEVVSESFSNFIRNNVNIPEIQRDKNEERVNSFYDTIIIQYEKMLRVVSSSKKKSDLEKIPLVPFLGILTVASLDNTLQIVDGQHRYNAMLKFRLNYKSVPFNIVYILHKCNNVADVVNLFDIHNNQYRIDPDVLASLFAGARLKLRTHLSLNYPDHFKTNSTNPRFPNLVLESFISDMVKVYREIKEDGNAMINKVEELNKKIGQGLRETDVKAYDKAVKKQSFFLAYLGKDDSDQMKKSPRMRLWEKFFGAVENEGKCYCCDAKLNFSLELKQDQENKEGKVKYTRRYHAGHIIARKHGGSGDISNLAPVCNYCNYSMGVQNMEEFRIQHYGSLHA